MCSYRNPRARKIEMTLNKREGRKRGSFHAAKTPRNMSSTKETKKYEKEKKKGGNKRKDLVSPWLM
jgi:hypothetical protein